ncbi:MAG: hypothetical protein CBE00_06685 [Planctomycetaceae bacterium TMED240]|nr:hypothetical protein [Rhodopirellula sp.]OUX06692.1 MAG: hypothetical protein CBE00_06685 [Planctomycetaceae bacterium TMED240]
MHRASAATKASTETASASTMAASTSNKKAGIRETFDGIGNLRSVLGSPTKLPATANPASLQAEPV